MVGRSGLGLGRRALCLALVACGAEPTAAVDTRGEEPNLVEDGDSGTGPSGTDDASDGSSSPEGTPPSRPETPSQGPSASTPQPTPSGEPSESSGTGGAGGAGGASGMAMGGAGGTGGNSSGGAGGTAPVIPADIPTRLDPIPPSDSSWTFPLANIYNVVQPVLAAIPGGVVIAGASGDPSTVGLEALDDGVVSEAFVARLDYAGQVQWTVPLLDAGAPRDVGVSATGEIVVVAPYMPGFGMLSSSSSYDDLYLVKLDSTGTILFERVLTFDLDQDGTTVYGMDVAADGSVTIAGMYFSAGGQHPLLAKYDAEGRELWVAPVDHQGVQGWANDAVSLPNGDVVFTGYFDGSANFGGETIESQGTWQDSPSVLPNGFLVRLDGDGQHVYSQRFGGTSVDGGTALARAGDDVILTGGASGAGVLADATLDASPDGSSFLASLDPSGEANWVTLGPGVIGRAVATDPAGNVYLGGQLGGDRIVASYDAEGAPVVEATVSGDGSIDSYALAVDDDFGVWVAGTFTGTIDFGNSNVISTTQTDVFLVRLQRLPIE